MDNNQESIEPKLKAKLPGSSYPVDTVQEVLDATKRIIDEYGSSRPITKEEISKILNKQVNSLGLFYSTLGQYGVFNSVHGKGYLPSDLYRKYTEPVHDNDEYKYKLMMFKSAPLYSKIIDSINGHTLPADETRMANLLKGEPYNIHASSAEKVARVFLENCKDLNLKDQNGKFKFPDLSTIKEGAKTDADNKALPTADPKKEEDLFELPIPLPNKRKAYLRYPIDDLSRKDIMVIQKALEFIASSISEDEEIKKE